MRPVAHCLVPLTFAYFLRLFFFATYIDGYCLLRRRQRRAIAFTQLPVSRPDEDEACSASAEEIATFFSPNQPLKGTDGVRKRIGDQEAPAKNEYSFFDEAVITVRAGSGGQGSNTYRKGVGNQNGPPDGGNGGRGGDVVFRLDSSLNTLAGLSHGWRPNSFGGSGAATTPQRRTSPRHFRAENGQPGLRQFKSGANGKEVVVKLPPGTLIQEKVETNGDSPYYFDIGTIDEASPEIVVARGGEGGEGTAVLKSGRGVKRPRTSAEGGQRKTLKLTLQLVADVALVGVPNAGKSTFLAAVTSAKPKISNYPFTTVIPNLGVWIPGRQQNSPSSIRGAGSDGLVICDVPGLIRGASEGVGLGHAFLRHVERCHVMVHMIDATSIDPIADYEMLTREVMRYGGTLASIPQVVVVNKVDAYETNVSRDWEEGLSVRIGRGELEERLKAVLPHSRLMWMSAREQEGLNDLMMRLAGFVRKVKQSKEDIPVA